MIVYPAVRRGVGAVSLLGSSPSVESIPLGSAAGARLSACVVEDGISLSRAGYVCFAVQGFQRRITGGSLEAKANILFPAQLDWLKV